jgi:hypothetical protein
MRKVKDVTINWGTPCPQGQEPLPGQNRDHGKVFRIQEMSAMQGEDWASRATLALLPRLSREVDADIAQELQDNPGMSSVARVGRLLGGIQFPEVKELMHEIMTCIQFVPDPQRLDYQRPINAGGSDDIEEIETLRILREEALSLHTGFTFAAGIFRLISATSMMDLSQNT